MVFLICSSLVKTSGLSLIISLVHFISVIFSPRDIIMDLQGVHKIFTLFFLHPYLRILCMSNLIFFSHISITNCNWHITQISMKWAELDITHRLIPFLDKQLPIKFPSHTRKSQNYHFSTNPINIWTTKFTTWSVLLVQLNHDILFIRRLKIYWFDI